MPLADPDVFARLSVRLRVADGGDGAGVSVLSVEGELDRATTASPEWREAVAEVCGDGADPADLVVLDLRRLYFLDLAGLHEFESLSALLTAGGARLALAGTRPRLREFLRQACADFGDEYSDLDEGDGIAAAPAPTARTATAA